MKTISTHKKHKRKDSAPCKNQNGMILILSLVFLGILALLGTTAVMLTTTDMKIGDNYKSSTQAFSAAQAGIAEARLRLNGSATVSGYGGDTGATANPLWSAYILTSGTWTTADDTEYNSNYTNYFPTGTTFTGTSPLSNTLQSSVDVDYFVKIRHKREFDAEDAGHTTTNNHYTDNDGTVATNTAASPGSIVYFGDDDPTDNTSRWVEFTTALNPTPREARPIEIIRSYGQSNGSLAVVEVEVKRAPLNIDVEAPLYTKGNLTGNGSALYVDGYDQAGTGGAVDCGGVVSPDLPPIYQYDDPSDAGAPAFNLNGADVDDLQGPGHPYALDGSEEDFSGPKDIPITEYVTTMGIPGSATETIIADQNGATYGADGNGNSVICYSDTSNPYNVQGLKLSNVTGYGILAVEGDLEMGGGFSWRGLVLCTGTLTFNGGGSGVNIYGAVLANQTVTINGGVDIQYDSCYIQEALQAVSIQVSRWRQVY
jgi:type IV pilus assembly PilX-like protein